MSSDIHHLALDLPGHPVRPLSSGARHVGMERSSYLRGRTQHLEIMFSLLIQYEYFHLINAKEIGESQSVKCQNASLVLEELVRYDTASVQIPPENHEQENIQKIG